MTNLLSVFGGCGVLAISSICASLLLRLPVAMHGIFIVLVLNKNLSTLLAK